MPAIDAWRTLLTAANKEGLIDAIKDKVDIPPESVVENYPQSQWSDYLGELGISLLHRGSILEELRKLAVNKALPQAQPGSISDPKSFLAFIEEWTTKYAIIISAPKPRGIPLQEREHKIQEVTEIVSENIKRATLGGAKAMHKVPTFTGAAGIGKTTLAEASVQNILDKFDSIKESFPPEHGTKAIHLTIDFSNGCRLGVLDAGLSPSVVIGLRIAYAYFAARRIDFPTFRSMFISEVGLFEVGRVLSAIRCKEVLRGNLKEKDLLYLLVIIDEVQTLFGFKSPTNTSMFKEIMFALCEHSGAKRPVMVQAFIAGTAHSDVMKEHEPTMYDFSYIDNPRLSLKAVFALVCYFAVESGAHSHCWALSRPFVQMLIDIDGLPRALECLFEECFGVDFTQALKFFSEILQPMVLLHTKFIRVAASIQSKYGIQSFINEHRKTAELILAHVLLNKPIDANTILGDQSLSALERSGHVFFDRNTQPIQFQMSYLFITIYNECLGLLPQPVAASLYQDTKTDWQDWERFNAFYETFRNNSFVAFGELQKPLRDLFAGAVGTTSTLDKLVTLRKIDSVQFLAHHFPSDLEAINKDSGQQNKWETGTSLFVNGKNASFGDTVSIRRLVENERHLVIVSGQEKWDYNGKNFTSSDATAEHTKAKETAAASRLSQHQHTIVTICFTSQPRSDTPTQDNILLISRESFKKYYGAFADCATFSAASTLNPNYANIPHLTQQLQQVGDEKAKEIVRLRMDGPYVNAADFLKRTKVHAPDSMSFFPCDLLPENITPPQPANQTTPQPNTSLEFPLPTLTYSPATISYQHT